MIQRIKTRRHPVLRAVETAESWYEKHHWHAFIITVVVVALVNCVVER